MALSILDYNKMLTQGAKGGYTPNVSRYFPQASLQTPVKQNTPKIYNTSVNTPIPSSIPDTSQNSAVDSLRQQEDALNQQLEADYNNAMSMLSGQEEGLRSQAQAAEGQITQEAGAVKTELSNRQTEGVNQQQANLQTAERQAGTATREARDLYRQIQQRNIAQLSALGISSSSVAEALAERLGVETARRIAQVGSSLTDIRTNAQNEISRINNYYRSKLDDLDNKVMTQKQQIQLSLQEGVKQIGNARNQAASEKAARRAGLLSQVNQALSSLAQQETQFKQQLTQWAQTKTNTLQKLVTDPQSILRYQQGIDTFNANPGIDFQYIGNYAFTPEGQAGFYPNQQLKTLKKNKVTENNPQEGDVSEDGTKYFLNGQWVEL